MQNRRNIVLTSTLITFSKKIMLSEIENLIKNSHYQNEVQKGRSTDDNLIILMAITNKNFRLGKYVFNSGRFGKTLIQVLNILETGIGEKRWRCCIY